MTWSKRNRKALKRILDQAEGRDLHVIHRRRKGRWYAMGAQLQSCKSEIREIAIKGRGFGIDLRASYPAILTGLIGELTSEHPNCLDMKGTTLMLRDTKSMDN